MKIEGVSNDSIQKSGPNPIEVKRIRELHAEGVSLKDLKRAFPDIVEDAIERWFDSLEAEVEAEEKKKAAAKPPEKPAAKPDPLK